ncbi:MAG: branched-chain amino acid aminotransferase [Saprospiraceae bacterium]|jgi:branched-chain amino acid aminotransferase|nr:branched-chain amino acid aminotransferase [Saprospiraceae bacterium]
MIHADAIPFTPIKESRLSQVDMQHLEFGKYISDHMFYAHYDHGKWNDIAIRPFADLSLSPSILGLHYGQTVFEGMKAFRRPDGQITIFRMDKHYQRFLASLDRMCMPPVPEDLFYDGMSRLISIDAAWVPEAEGSSLYIRPFMFASEARFGVKVAEEYLFIIFSGPVGPYYAKPLRVKVELDYVRAAKGGTGYAKCGGNYGGSYYPTQKAKAEGFDQVIWTDGRAHEFIEESGTMNLMFVIDGKVVTPPTSDSILDGVTRDSILTIASDLGYEAEVRPLSIEELENALKAGRLQEAFGAGTAAVVAPIAIINVHGHDYQLPSWDDSSFMMKAKHKLTHMRMGMEPDVHDWNTIISPM